MWSTTLPLWVVYPVVALAIYRAQRFVTADTWPPMKWVRARIVTRFGADSAWYNLSRCAWCFGSWIALAATPLVHLFCVDLFSGRVRNRAAFLAMVAFAVATVVGRLGQPDP